MKVQFMLSGNETAEIIGSEPNKEIKIVETVDSGWWEGIHYAYEIAECDISVTQKNILLKNSDGLGTVFYAETLEKGKDPSGYDIYYVTTWAPLM